MRRPHGCLAWAIVGWALLVLLLEALTRTPARRWGLLAIVDLLHPWRFLPVVPLTLLALLNRPRRWLVPLLLLACIWLGSYAARWFPPAPPPGAGPPLRVLTWNVAGWNLDAADLDRVVSAENPAIIALQEVDGGLRRSLIERWGTRYPFFELRLPTEPGLQPADLALFSRYPYTTSPLDCPYWQCYRRAVTVRLPDRALTLINVHIEHSPLQAWQVGGVSIPYALNTEREDRTIDRLLSDTAGWSAPLLIVGDFNTTERQAGYRQLAARWGDSWRERGRGLGMTWPRTTLTPPLLRIDYLWHSEHLIVQRAAVGSGRSDHRYLLADFVWR
jgi:endonuclease/exonuclease/phosphatase (EEP) superfamily protein YafD